MREVPMLIPPEDPIQTRSRQRGSERSDRLAENAKGRGWYYLEKAELQDSEAGKYLMDTVVRQNADYRDLSPLEKADARPGSMSAMVGKDAQPMHTDGAYLHLPPRYTVLMCMNPGETDCPTTLWTMNFFLLKEAEKMGLYKPLWVWGDGINPLFYAPIIETYNGTMRVRFDELCMQSYGNTPTPQDVGSFINVASEGADITWSEGSVLIIDNWRCLHARGWGADSSPSRVLRRWYLRG